MRWLRAAVWLAALTPAVWLATQFHDIPHLGDFHDDALYVAGAKSIAEGTGHTQISLPERPAQTKYPPLFPLWLSAGWRIDPNFPGNLPGFLPLLWIWLPALALISQPVFRDLGFSAGWAWMLSAVVLLNPLAAYFSVSPMAELAMATLLMAGLALAERGKAAAAGIAIALAFLTKTAALPALVSIPLVFGIRRQFRKALYFALIAWPAFLGWAWWTAQHRSPGSAGDYYVDYVGFYLANHSWSDLPMLAIKNFPILILSAGRLLAFTGDYSGWANYLATLLGLVSLFSFARLGGRLTMHHALAALFVPMLVFWNFTPHERFLLPILPFLIAGLAAEIRQMPRMMTWSKPAAVALAATILWIDVEAIVRRLPTVARAERAARRELEPAYRWIRESTPATASFLAARDPLLYLYTGRAARGMHFPTQFFYRDQRERILDYFAATPEFMEHHRLTYALITDTDHAMDLSPGETQARAAKVNADPRLKPLFSKGSVRVLTLQSERDSPVAPPAASFLAPRR